MIDQQGELVTCSFGRFGLREYDLFKRTKLVPEGRVEFDKLTGVYTVAFPARFAHLIGYNARVVRGVDVPSATHLWDYQAFFQEEALRAKRYAVWADTGLGKTAIFLEWMRRVMARTAGKVLLLSPKNIISQTLEQAAGFYGGALDMLRLESREELVGWLRAPGTGLAVTNYEKFIEGTIPELNGLAGLALDESSLLKTGGGVIKWNLIKSARGIEYKLSLTATPAPNDVMEYASQASFLEKLRNDGEILWTYFIRDKNGEWKIRPHAREAFYRFMSGWSVYLRSPARYGFRDNLKDLPDPEVVIEEVEMTPEQAEVAAAEKWTVSGDFLADDRVGVTLRSRFNQIAKGFVYTDGRKEGSARRFPSKKPDAVVRHVREMRGDGRQVIVWTLFDEESDILLEMLAGVGRAVALTGATKPADRDAMVEEFRQGKIDVLVTRARMMGKGMNFQFCTGMVFSGFSDSFEDYYQAVRRCYRYGQTQRVKVVIPYIPALEGMIWENVKRKQRQWEHDTAVQEANYIEALRDAGVIEVAG